MHFGCEIKDFVEPLGLAKVVCDILIACVCGGCMSP